jgi:hypothetical protein
MKRDDLLWVMLALMLGVGFCLALLFCGPHQPPPR